MELQILKKKKKKKASWTQAGSTENQYNWHPIVYPKFKKWSLIFSFVFGFF